ncbi:WXG100 family type VII secretion target [Clostridium folliculivorans]|uniref:WXG100 family type VII secretion target n=1 Tax=Clostridium folliculivorans TaxID=2886038 RepID=UPI0021C3B63A|nr:WXG100 family type VII secretion target [Clostridium folliculivorans]GKU29320.1 hypothetical protein CFB3_14260 [Clostridium folliculivorans]
MALGKFKVSTEELRRSSTVILDKTAMYEAEYAKIYAEIANLRVEWQGQASEAFNKQIEEYRNDFQELAKILKSYAEFLRTAAGNFEKTEDNLQNRIKNLRVGK